MLRGSFMLGVLLSLSCLVFGDAPENEQGILADLGITRQEAIDLGIIGRISQIIKVRASFFQWRSDWKIRGGLTGCRERWNASYYNKWLPNLRKEYGDLKIEQAKILRQSQADRQLQATLVDIQKQLKEQSEKMDKLVAGNAQFIRFLVLMDSAITSERDIRARVEAAKQLLESDLVDEQQKVLLLNNKIKELKEKAETVAVENAELRAQMQAELEAIQVQLKERMLSMM